MLANAVYVAGGHDDEGLEIVAGYTDECVFRPWLCRRERVCVDV
jgi:hypothetical protein